MRRKGKGEKVRKKRKVADAHMQCCLRSCRRVENRASSTKEELEESREGPVGEKRRKGRKGRRKVEEWKQGREGRMEYFPSRVGAAA